MGPTVESITANVCVCVGKSVKEGRGSVFTVCVFVSAESVGQYLLNRNQIPLIMPYPQKGLLDSIEQHICIVLFVCVHALTMCCVRLCVWLTEFMLL